MSTVVKLKDTKKSKLEGIEKAIEGGATTIGGFSLPIGKHNVLVAEENAFALLNVVRKSDGQKFALPIVAGTITLESGSKVETVLSDKPGAKTLVVPDSYFVEMQCNAEYTITIEERNGRKVVTAVTPSELEENVVAESQVQKPAEKKKQLAF